MKGSVVLNPGFGCWNVKRQLSFIVDKIIHSTDALIFGFQSATTTSVYSHFNDWLTLAEPFIVDIVVNVSSATEGKDFYQCSKSNERQMNTSWFWWPSVVMSNSHP